MRECSEGEGRKHQPCNEENEENDDGRDNLTPEIVGEKTSNTCGVGDCRRSGIALFVITRVVIDEHGQWVRTYTIRIRA